MSKILNRGINIFYSYAYQDEWLLNELEKHLSVLKREALITSWYSRKIIAGMERAHEIDAHLNTAQIILLLISPDFMASDYCFEIEVQQALKRQRDGDSVVIPIILRPVYWSNAPFGILEALPPNGKAVTSWPGRHGIDEAFTRVSIGIRAVIEEIRSGYLEEKKAAVDRILHQGNTFLQEKKTTGDSRIPRQLIRGIWHNQAYALHGRNRYEEALIVYEQIIRLYSEDFVAYIGKGDTLYRLERYQEALVAYERAIHIDPDDPTGHSGKGDTLCKLNRSWGAIDAYDQALRLDPNNADIYYRKGNAHLTVQRYREAIDAYEQALRLDPNNADIYYHKGNAHLTVQRYREAIDAYEQALRLDFYNADIYYHKGNAHFNLQQYEEALTAYKRAITIDPKNVSAHIGKGDTLHKLEHYEEALTVYEQLLVLDSNNASVYRNVLTFLKQYKRAEPE